LGLLVGNRSFPVILRLINSPTNYSYHTWTNRVQMSHMQCRL